MKNLPASDETQHRARLRHCGSWPRKSCRMAINDLGARPVSSDMAGRDLAQRTAG